ncbi:MAG TPA: signal peptidase II, partial [Prochlorococcus sp.]|nr:signal peptidase II [Prochlorococcus sp.]
GLLQLRLISNTGAAFNLFNGATFLLGLLSLAVTIGLMVWIWRAGQMPLWQGLAVSFLLGGTIGNGLDRWRLGHVTDFLQLVPVDFPIFNGADVAINLAVICFGIDALTRRHGQQHT